MRKRKKEQILSLLQSYEEAHSTERALIEGSGKMGSTLFLLSGGTLPRFPCTFRGERRLGGGTAVPCAGRIRLSEDSRGGRVPSGAYADSLSALQGVNVGQYGVRLSGGEAGPHLRSTRYADYVF